MHTNSTPDGKAPAPPLPGVGSAGAVANQPETTRLAAVCRYVDELNPGFDLQVLRVLDDTEATPAAIEALKDKLSAAVTARLFGIANSVHFGKNRSGQITRFIDVVSHLGTNLTKSLTIFIALHALTNTEAMRRVFARCFATSKLAEALSLKLGLPDHERTTATLAGLFIEIGKAAILLSGESRDAEWDDDFIERHYPVINVRLTEKFALPAPVVEIVARPPFCFVKKDTLALSAVVELAHSAVEKSFARDGKWVIESCMPDPDGILYHSTAGSCIVEQFQLVGLGAYLEVIPSALTDVQRRLLEKNRH